MKAATLAIQRASRAAHIPPDARLRRWAKAALDQGAEVTLRYVAEAEGRRLNREYRGKDYATNVLTFVYGQSPLSGDIVICAPVVAREAREENKPLTAHYAHLTVHGALQLLGWYHVDDREAVALELLERQILAELGLDDPSAGEE